MVTSILLGAGLNDPPPEGSTCRRGGQAAWWCFDTADRELARQNLSLVIRRTDGGLVMEARHRDVLLREPEPVPGLAIDRTKLPVDGRFADAIATLADSGQLRVVSAFEGEHTLGELACDELAAVPLTRYSGRWTDIDGKRFAATQWRIDAPPGGWQAGHWLVLSARLAGERAHWMLAPEYRVSGARFNKHALSGLAPGDALEQALLSLVAGCIHHWQDNLSAVAAGHPEGIHQARVALRRLRSLLKLYRKHLPKACLEPWMPVLKQHASALGAVRDWDVFCAEGLAPATVWIPHAAPVQDLIALSERARGKAFARLQRHLRSRDFSRLLVWLQLWACSRPWRDGSEGLDKPVRGFAKTAVKRLERRVRSMADDFVMLDTDGRHRLRIRIKQLRYACEFFSGLPGVPAGSQRRQLAALQDHLGALNDAAVARRLMDELGIAADSPSRAAAEGWFAGRSAVQVDQFPALWSRYRE